jgi:sigma-E factor negative regulatory protein RseB
MSADFLGLKSLQRNADARVLPCLGGDQSFRAGYVVRVGIGGAMLGLLACLASVDVFAQVGADGTTSKPPATAATAMPVRSVSEWLLRMHQASVRRAYVGTYVVSSQGNLSSAKIWHICDGTQQLERVEALTGPAKSTYRHNDQVMTFFPATKVALVENRTTLGLFPGFLSSVDAKVDEHYAAARSGNERIAGVDAEVVHLRPKDDWRFGYRLWVEAGSGLVVKMQTMDGTGTVMEEMAFSELQLGAPVKLERLARKMTNTDGYRVEKIDVQRTSAEAEGWTMGKTVDGFKSMSCFRRQVGSSASNRAASTVQWIFSDGLASVSLFIEPFDPQRHAQEGSLAQGATRTLTKRRQDWWVTAVGEVPLQTLQAFVGHLSRSR